MTPATGEPEAFACENVGAADNAGWEFEASLRKGYLSLAASLALVNSRVTRLADAYIGDLRPGDGLLGVPARTASVAASWIAPRWSASVGAWRAADWINYDRVALAHSQAEDSVPAGPGLRYFWIEYPGITHLRVTLSRDLRPGLTLGLRATF